MLALLPVANELSIGVMVDARPPEDMLSMNGFKKGRQEAKMAKLSCIVVNR